MAVGMRPKLGNTLQSLVAGDDRWPMPRDPMGMPPQMPGMDPAMEVKPRSKGQMIAGIIGDTLASISGGQPLYTQSVLRDRQQAQQDQREEVQWTRRREAENQDWTNREAWKRANPEPSSMERDAATWQRMGPDQRQAYLESKRGDPFVTTSLPNGQFYAGPQSGLLGALTGQGAPASTTPTAPVGKLRPVGGGASNGTGGFQR